MATPDTVHAYLEDLRRRLRFDPLMAHRVLREVADHLADAVAVEQSTGAPRHEAEARAVGRFGSPAELVRQLGEHATLRLLSLVGATASLVVGWLIGFVAVVLLPRVDAGLVPLWSLVALGYMVYGALTWLHLTRLPRWVLRRLLALGSILAIGVGLFAFWHSLYLARVTGDWEIYVTLFGLVLAAHGSALLLYLWRVALTRPAATQP